MKNANVFFVSIDSLRRDFLYAYAPESNRSTYIDEMADKGMIFDNAFPGGNWTMPSHATMLTGLDTTSHMIWSWQHRFAEGTRTAFRYFHDAGYSVGCFAIQQLRDLFAGEPNDYTGGTDDPGLLKCLEDSRPFFVFWHTYNVHYPYGMVMPRDFDDTQSDFDQRSRTLNYLRSLIVSDRTSLIHDSYRREIRRAARFIQRVAAKLERLGKLDKTYFVVTADHGEAWKPDTTFHCNFHEAVLRVPLMIWGPDVPQSRMSSPVSLVSLLPTLLDLCDIPSEAGGGFEGASLMNGRSNFDHAVVIAGPNGARARHRYIAVRNSRWMLITAMNHWWESFHEIGNAGPSSNLMDHPMTDNGLEALEEFRAIADRHAERLLGKRDVVVELSKTTERKLRALGYV
jgi:arylsulfatase A-like enzyme